jgi:prephenate dehydrogenase
MDVGSTSATSSTRRAACLGSHRLVCAAHPIAGKEVSGIAHADASLYAGRQVILTPLQKTSPDLVQKATDTWSAIGAQVLRMTPENHDAAFASVSHLPHLLAFAYFSAVVNQPAGRDTSLGVRASRLHAHRGEQLAVWRDIRWPIAKKSRSRRCASGTLDALEHVINTENSEALEELIRSAPDAQRLADERPTLHTSR